MAAAGPAQGPWPTELREHATYGKYLRDALQCIEQSGNQPVPAGLVQVLLAGAASLMV
jgi:hypothetical protein